MKKLIRMKAFFFAFFFIFHECAEERLQSTNQLNWNDDWKSNFVQKEVGENFSLQCSDDSSWMFPTNSNTKVARFESSEFMNRTQIEHNEQGSILHLQNLTVTDTGSYGCRGVNFMGVPPEEVYLFVKGPKTFLQSNDRFLVFSIEQLTHNITIPCRTTVMITEAKVRLFVNDVEWREWCRLNSVVANCLELRYDARVGFMLPSESFFMDNLDWINQNRFKCEYEKEETEFLVQVTQQMSLDHPVGIDKLNCTLNGKYTLFMDSYGSRLNVSCPECHLNMSLLIFGLFHDERFLEKIALLKRLPTNHMQHFCDWLEALVNGGNDHEFPFEVIPKDTQETVFLNFLEGPTISDIVRYFTPISIILIAFLLCCALLLISLCGYIYCPRKRKKSEPSEPTKHSSVSYREYRSATPAPLVGPENSLIDMQLLLPTATLKTNSANDLKKRLIGHGPYGTVYELIGHKPPAVIKQFLYEASPMKVQLEKECQILQKLKHQNIIRFLATEFNEENNASGIIMEFCQRGTLRETLSNPRMIYTMKTVIIWGVQLFDGLDYIFREHQIVHRDIKPENLFLADNFSLKIGDFGFAKRIEHTCSGTIFGTMRYMSPPQHEKTHTLQDSHRNDVYSLGLVLWEIVERRLAFSEFGHRGNFDRDEFIYSVVCGRFTKLERPRCQEELSQIIDSCTQFDRSKRLTAAEALDLLKTFFENDSFIGSLSFRPSEEKEQEKILRPIGFDGTKERIPIGDLPDGRTTRWSTFVD